jgi:UDP-glucose 4-epimerase
MSALSLLKNRNILVTGGAGYIGSHTSRQLVNAGCNVIVVDNFYSGHRWAVPKEAILIEGDAGDLELMTRLLSLHHIEAVIHFAGHIVVPESVADPLKYHRNNTCCSLNLIDACMHRGMRNFVFSSSAAVYGIPSRIPVAETAPTSPINPYGRTKLMTEWMLEDTANSFSSASNASTSPQDRFRYVALRYFNVAGASRDGSLGQATPNASHLIKVACEAACGKRGSISIYGTDYPTPDGTCIRDYIHVEDLAQAHLLALAHLFAGGSSEILNCGYGTGFSVREILAAVKEVSGVQFKIIETERRAGDPPALISDPQRIKELFAWQPTLQNIHQICETAYKWEKTGLNN